MYYFPLMSVIPTYFNRNRGAAMGIVVSGAGVGGLVLSPVFHVLLTRVGIRWSLRVLGLWNFALSIPIVSVLKKHGAAGATGQTRVSMAIVKRGTFVLQACHLLLCLFCRGAECDSFDASTSPWGASCKPQATWCPITTLRHTPSQYYRTRAPPAVCCSR